MKLFCLIITLLCCLDVQTKPVDDYYLYFVRHAEKAKEPKKNPALTEQGMATASALAHWMTKVKLQEIYSTDYLRTKTTAMPTAELKKLPVTEYDPRDLKSLASQLIANKKTALVVGHSNTTPVLIRLVGGVADDIPESEYGVLYEVKFEKNNVVGTNQYLFTEKNGN